MTDQNAGLLREPTEAQPRRVIRRPRRDRCIESMYVFGGGGLIVCKRRAGHRGHHASGWATRRWWWS